jgi:anti-anti-sigma factor
MTENHPGPFEHDDPRRAAELAALEELQVEHELVDDRTVQLRPVGELDMLTAPVLHERIGGFLAERARLVVDLSRLTFLDSAGLRTLLLAHADGRVELRNPSPVVRQTFEVAKMIDLLVDDGSRR